MYIKYTLVTNDFGEENCISILSPHRIGERRYIGRGKDYVIDIFDEIFGEQIASITHFYDNHGEGNVATEKLIPAEGYEPVFISNSELYNKEAAKKIGSYDFKLLESQEGYLVMAVWDKERWVVDFNCTAYGLSYMEIHKELGCEQLEFQGHKII